MNRPGVGVLAILKYNDFILLGQRKGSHGHGEWAFPGGHLELNELPEECAKRELLEETNIDISKYTPIELGYTNDIFVTDKKHYITLFFLYNVDQMYTPNLNEPDKCFQWKWVNKYNMPKPLFLSVKNIITKNTLLI